MPLLFSNTLPLCYFSVTQVYFSSTEFVLTNQSTDSYNVISNLQVLELRHNLKGLRKQNVNKNS